MFRIFLFSAVSLLAAGAAVAADEAQARYQLKEMDGGVVRLDTVTGDLSLCRDVAGSLQCSAMDGESVASTARIDALEARVRRLEKELADLKSKKGADMPSDAEVDRSLSIMEKFMRRFMGIAKEFGGETEGVKPNGCNPLPQTQGTCL